MNDQRLIALQMRAKLNRLIRDFFAHNALEVETPILSQGGNTDVNIESFHLQFSGHRDAGAAQRWLRTSPEYPLKRLLAEGVGDCYELGRVFRNGEAGGRHNPEFTMLEWYRLGQNHLQIAEEAIELIKRAMALVNQQVQVQRMDYRYLFQGYVGINPHSATIEQLQGVLDGISINPQGLSKDDWLDLIITHKIQPCFSANSLTLVYDFPASQCALARLRSGDVTVAERFELYLGNLELVNGYHELNDADEQAQRFARDLKLRQAQGKILPPHDQAFLHSVAQLPDCAGAAMGIDRLLMAMLGTDKIADVLAFDFANA